jgi:ClpP class serine protease
MRRARFAPSVPCAIEPRAFGVVFDMPAPPVVEWRGDIALVSVRGCLMHHADDFFDSYDAIKSRVAECLASESKPRAIVLSLDSPGGLVSGAFDTTDEIRARCADAGVPLYAYVDGQACSAAYALACAGSRIVIPPTGMVGSIGCIAELVDVSKMNAAMGVSVALITSGKRKSDGNPAIPLDDGAVGAIRGQVMQLAEIFFEHVALARPMQVDEVRALEAGLLIGASAVPMLADDVMGLDEMIAAIAAGTFGQVAPVGAESVDSMTTKSTGANVGATKASDDEDYEAAIATLRKAAAGGNAKAKKMLQAEVADDEPDGDEGGEEKKPAAAAAPAAEAPPTPEKKDDEKDAKAVAALALAEAKTGRREAMLAARPDITPELRATLETLDPDAVRAILAATPKPGARKLGDHAATAVVPSTRGETQTSAPVSALSASHKAQIDAAMGIKSKPTEPTFINGVQTFPALTRAEGVAWQKKEAARVAAETE